MHGLFGGQTHSGLPGGQRLACLFGADAPGYGHLDRLIRHPQKLLPGGAQAGLGRGRHDGHHILKAFSGTVGHLLRIGKNLLHDGFRRVHDFAQISERIFGADGQFDRKSHRGSHGRSTQQTPLQIGTLRLQGAGLAPVGGHRRLDCPGTLKLGGQLGVIPGQGTDAAARTGSLSHGLPIGRRLSGQGPGQTAHPGFGLFYLPGHDRGHGPGL